MGCIYDRERSGPYRMSNRQLDLEKLLALGSRDALRQALRQTAPPMLPQIQRLTDHAAGLAPAMRELRLGIVHSYTSELLDPWLCLAGALEGLDVKIHHGPYGLNLEQADARSSLVAHSADITLMLLRRGDLHPIWQGRWWHCPRINRRTCHRRHWIGCSRSSRPFAPRVSAFWSSPFCPNKEARHLGFTIYSRSGRRRRGGQP